MKIIKATNTEEDLKVGDVYYTDGTARTILAISAGDKLTELEVSEEGSSDEEVAKAITKEQKLANVTVVTKSGKEFYGNSEARVDLLSAITASQITGQTETQWKLVTGLETVTVAELSEAMLLALQKKGQIVGAV